MEFRIGRFRRDEADLITQDVVEGNIIQMTDRVVDILKTKYFTSPIHYEGMQRIETLEVPENALREILYNAIIHKDYTGVHIQMRVWDDYCEIWNEGSLPEGITPEALLGKHSSHPRNKNIAYAFFKAGFIESWGRGYKKIREGFEGTGLPMPQVEDIEGGVRVIFQRNNVNSSQTGSVSTEKTTEKILRQLRTNPHITNKQLAEICGISVDGIYWNMKQLRDKGLIRRVDGRKEGHWEIIE